MLENCTALTVQLSFKLSRRNQLPSCQGEINVEGEILNALKQQATFARIYSIMKKTQEFDIK